MRNRRRRRVHNVESLRLAIDCLPVATREAMLAGVRASERIIVGAYIDGDGGVCPMLAAHRSGGRTDFLSFAKSWDRFTRADGKAREATAREVAHPGLPAGGQPARAPTAWSSTARSRSTAGCAAKRRRRRRPGSPRSPTRTARSARGAASGVLSASPGRMNIISGHHARGGDLEQVADRLGDVLRADHLLGGDLCP